MATGWDIHLRNEEPFKVSTFHGNLEGSWLEWKDDFDALVRFKKWGVQTRLDALRGFFSGTARDALKQVREELEEERPREDDEEAQEEFYQL